MKTLRRALVIGFGCALLIGGLQSSAQAQTGSSTITATLENIADQLDDLNDAIGDIDGGGQEQSQEQNQNILFDPRTGGSVLTRVGSSGSKTLPKTGVDVAEVGGVGTMSLVAGMSLVEFARRRRRNWIEPTMASEALATTTLAPRLGENEADLLLPYMGPGAPQQTQDPGDHITPSF